MLCFHAAQTGKHLLLTQNVSEQSQIHFLCPGHTLCIRNKCCARGQTGKHLCPQQCVRNNASSFARALMSRKMVLHVRFEPWYISLPCSAKQQREITKFYVFWRTRTAVAYFLYHVFELNAFGACSVSLSKF